MINPKLNSFVSIIWKDSASIENGWKYVKDSTFEPVEVLSVGFVIFKSKEVIVLSANISNGGLPAYNGGMIIYRKQITNISDLAKY